MFVIKDRGSFKKTFSFLNNINDNKLLQDLSKYGKIGSDALSKATPIDSSTTANSWGYTIVKDQGKVEIVWYNKHVDNGVNVAILIQYGHATGTGGYVEGRDYINPAIKPIFDKILDDVWKRVQNA